MGNKLIKVFESSTGGVLYVGPLDFICEEGSLTKLEITSVMSCLPSISDKTQIMLRDEQNVKRENVYHCRLDDVVVRGSDNHILTIPMISSCCDWLKNKLEKGENVLVHCDQGIRRSPTICTAFLMRYSEELGGKDLGKLEDAFREMIRMKPNFEPAYLMNSLRDWEKKIRERE